MHIVERSVNARDASTIALARLMVSKFNNTKLKRCEMAGMQIAVANQGHRGFMLEWWGKAPPHSDYYPLDIPFHSISYDGVRDRVEYYSYRSADPERVVLEALLNLSRPSLHLSPGWLNQHTMTP